VNLTDHPAKDNCPFISPDGQTIVFLSDRSGNFEIFKMNIDGSAVEQLTFCSVTKEHPQFSPDGKQVMFLKDYREKTEIWIMDQNGSNQRQLTSNDWRDERPFLSPDGKHITCAEKVSVNGRMLGVIRMMDADGKNDVEITAREDRDENAAWSPDGRQIVFQRVVNGNFDIYQVDVDGTNLIWITHHPDWDGWASFIPVTEEGEKQ